MNKELKGLCLFLGLIGLAYTAVLILCMLVTGIKIVKSILFVSIFSSFLVSLGLTSEVKRRLVKAVKAKMTYRYIIR
jgi:hypothetical protein